MAEESALHGARRIRVTAIVHVIEARDLAGKDSNRLSDPFVRVTVAGKRQTTEIRRNSINATWDQTFTFQDMDMTMEDFQAELVVLQVFDANVLFPNELIGQFSFGLAKVRSQLPPHRHQVYRRWLVLTDPKNPLEEQGFLQVSVTVLGPGDIPPAHSRQEDYASLAAVSNQQGSNEERILRKPEVQRRGYNFAIKVFRGEDLAVTDPWNNVSDPFVVVRFNGLMARTPHQPRTTSPNWNHLLVLPIYTPCFSNTIEIQLYDYVRGQPDRLLATRRLAFTSLLGQSFPPSWFNFYGRMDEERDSSGWVCDVIRSLKSDRDATNYMGRILMSLNTELTKTPMYLDKPCAPIKGPKAQPYLLHVDVYEIAELDLSYGRKVMIELQFGPHKRQSDWCSVGSVQPRRQRQRRPVRNSDPGRGRDDDEEEDEEEVDDDDLNHHANGVLLSCSGENAHDEHENRPGHATRSTARKLVSSSPAQLRSVEVELPTRGVEPTTQECAQFYDIVLNVYVKGVLSSPQRVGYLRFKAVDVMGHQSAPEWSPVRGVTNKSGASETPAQLLASVRLGPKVSVPKRQPMEPPARERFQLRAHVYQARGLRATDAQGLANPYVNITLGGKTARLAVTSREDKLVRVAEINHRRQAELLAYSSYGSRAASPGSGPAGTSPGASKQTNEVALDPKLLRTSVVASSLDPVWYESLVIDDVKLPAQLSLAPDVDIRVLSKVEGSSDELVGRVKFPASLCALDLWPTTKRPRWLRLARGDLTALRPHTSTKKPESALQASSANFVESEFEAEDRAGDILIKLELIPAREIRSYPLWAHRWPRVVPCALHLGTVGLRRLEEYGFFGSIDKPFCQILVQSVPNMLAPSAIATHIVDQQDGGRGHDTPSSNNISNNYRGGPAEVISATRPSAAGPAPSRQRRGLGRRDNARGAATGPGALDGDDDLRASQTTTDTDEEVGRLAAGMRFAFDALPLNPQTDMDSATGALQGRWLMRARQVEKYVDRLLYQNASGAGPGASQLFHPHSCVRGVASWSNRREEDKSLFTKLFAADDLQQRGVNGVSTSSSSNNTRKSGFADAGADAENSSRAANRGRQSPEDNQVDEANGGRRKRGGDLESGLAMESDPEDEDDLSETEIDLEAMVRKERKRRTFFDTVTVTVNMPIDPFYAPSMTIKVFDERFAKAEVIATATISVRDFVDPMLYSSAMRIDAKLLEAAFEIPRIHSSGKAKKDFREWVRRSPDAFDESYYESPRHTDEVDEKERGVHISDLQGELARVRQEYLSDAAKRSSVASPRSAPMSMPGVSIEMTPMSLADDDDEALYDRAFRVPAEGHFDLPPHILEETDDMNAEFEDDLRAVIFKRGIQIDEDKADAHAGDTYAGDLLWPQEDEQTRKANMLTHLLEASAALEPKPFQSIALFRGAQLETMGTRKPAGIFKATIMIRPDVDEFERTLVVREAHDMSGFEPLPNSRGELVEPLFANAGELVLFEEDLDKLHVVVRSVTYRPDAPLRVGPACYFPRKKLAELPDPFTLSSGSMLEARPTTGGDAAYGPHSTSAGKALTHERSNNQDDLEIAEGDDESDSEEASTSDDSTEVVRYQRQQQSESGAYVSIAKSMHRPQNVKVRVYVVACANLPSQAYFSSSSDPYLVIQLNVPPYLKDTYPGAVYFNGRSSYKTDTLDPYFGAWVELDARFPDVHELEIQVWNANYLNDDLIGKTVIDLEDRWFNPAWHNLKYKRKQLKEFRPLHAPSSKLVQGVCECWVEMFHPGDAASTAIVDIREPKVEPWQLRLVIWETRRVPLLDDHTTANLYVTGELTFTDIQGRTHQREFTTDVHTGLKDGKGIFNYRMLFPFQAPAKFARLKIKVWESYYLSYTALGESNIDLTPLMREAVRSQGDVIDRTRTWVALSHSNWPDERRGDLDIQMSLVREKYSLLHPVGEARNAPNENPFLPDPPRETLFRRIFRSAGYGRTICCTVCVLLVLFVIFFVVFSP